MVEKAAGRVISALIDRIQQRHDEATAVLEATSAFANRGKTEQALKTLMDFEGPTRDALDLFKTALTIKRELLSPGD